MAKNSKKPSKETSDDNKDSKGKKTAGSVPKTSASRTSSDDNNKQDKRIPNLDMKMDMNSFMSKGLLYVVLGIIGIIFFFSVFSSDPNEEISISQLVSDIREDQVEQITVSGEEMRVMYTDETVRIVQKETGQTAVEILEAAGVNLTDVQLEVESFSLGSMVWELIISLLPILLMIGFFFIIFRQARGGQSGIMGIGKSKAKLFVKGKQDTSFDDVGGMDEAKNELEEVVDFLKNPKKYSKVGARTPKGVLLIGPAGTGKTLLARAVAGEANVQFLSIAGSEFMEMLVGVGASRVRDLFTTAKKLSPSIIFIDEIDAIGQTRGKGSFGGHDEREQTLNQILVEMDGFDQNDNVIVMAATNRGDMLDQALIRPGRFDRRVMVRLPDLDERKYIISIHAEGKPFAEEVKWEKVAKRTVGFSGADIENMLNEAAIAVARDDRKDITMDDIEEAALKVKLGPSKKRLQNKLERKMTAYHEAGHAIAAHASPHADTVRRISIVSRGRALGFTLSSPERDKFQTTRSELIDRITVLLGGRAAEQMIFDEQTAGAGNDIERATRIARAMVVEYGMSELGAMNYGPQYETTDYGKAWGEPLKISDRLQEKVDEEINDIIREGEKRATDLLTEYRKQLDAVSNKLLDKETVDGEEFEDLMGFKKIKVEDAYDLDDDRDIAGEEEYQTPEDDE